MINTQLTAKDVANEVVSSRAERGCQRGDGGSESLRMTSSLSTLKGIGRRWQYPERLEK